MVMKQEVCRFSSWPWIRGVFLCCFAVSSAAGADQAKLLLRQPVALVLTEDGKRLFVANQHSGTVSCIDTAVKQVTAEMKVGDKLSDLAMHGSSHLLAIDQGANQLLVLIRVGMRCDVSQRLDVSPAPATVQVSADGARCYVASLWSRRVSFVELAAGQEPGREPNARVKKVIDLPFAPRNQLLVDGDMKLIVADAFGGRLAVLDTARGEVDSIRTLPAHNIRALKLNGKGDRVLITHQILNGLAQTTFEDVHWGNVITNNLRSLVLADLVEPGADLLAGSYVQYLGDVGRAAGDPSGLALGTGDELVIGLSGVGEVAIGRDQETGLRRLSVGRRPTALVTSPDRRRAYAANTFSDSISVIDLVNKKIEAEIPLGAQPELTTSERGERLFYDARLTHDGWFSCHSCHSDGHTNGLLNDNLGDGSFGAPKRVLSLLGVKDTGPWAWNGGMPELERQVRKSIETTMHGNKPADEQVQALTAYLKTLPAPPSLARLRGRVDEPAVRRGQNVFQEQGCNRCHTPPFYTSSNVYDVGLVDEVGNTHFNPPSLRGVSQGGPYFHDGRALTLEDIFTHHHHQVRKTLDRAHLQDLLDFLGSL
jgi:YVTN family beta-propeller protein